MSLTRYKTNPFVADMIVPVKNKRIRLSRMGGDKQIVVDQTSGESSGTHLTTYKRVDGAQFIKLFTANIGMTFDLSAAGIKAFSAVLWIMQNSAISLDQIDLDMLALEEFVTFHANDKKPLRLSSATFKRGLNELEKAQIIAKTLRKGRYFINPNFVFNGDRIAFTTVIERREAVNGDDKTLDIFGDE